MEDIFSLIGINEETIIYPSDHRYEMLDLTVRLAGDGSGGIRIGSMPGYNYLRITNPHRFVIFYTDPSTTGYEVISEARALDLIALDVLIELGVPDEIINSVGNQRR